MKNEFAINSAQEEPRRKLSPWRVTLMLILLSLIGYGSSLSWKGYEQHKAEGSFGAWFAPYVDVTSTPTYTFEQIANTSSKNVILSFIVSSPDDSCVPTWGGTYTPDQARDNLDLDRRIARFKQQGGDLAISFGGLLNDELAVKCKDQDKLFSVYKSIIERYKIDTIDLDIEGEGLNNKEAMARRSEVLYRLQTQYKAGAGGKKLKIWLTLPVITTGLSSAGTDVVANFLSAGVDLAGINVMTMNYGQSRQKGQTMLEASKEALNETHRQLGILYKQAGLNLSSASLLAKIAATPMIGQNDTSDEIFTLDDAIGLNKFILSKGNVRLSMWSANRDVQCSDNYVNVTVVSDSCSGIEQQQFAFTKMFSKGLDSSITQTDSTTLIENQSTSRPNPDNPDDSPYQIWQEFGTYLEGTKVVWHQNVYEAKWWTQGDAPDNPVLQSWQSPWKLIGPVLLGEKPVPLLSLPAGTYPKWEGTAIYDAGQRVLFNNVPFQAKWWTQGDSPAAVASNPNDSPWLPLSLDQIKGLKKKIQKSH